MILVAHRRNRLQELLDVPPNQGVEIDLRSRGDSLILQHEPFTDGELFETWLTGYRHRLLILNVKEEGLESRVLAAVRSRGIEEFFFLDQSFPFLVKTALGGEHRVAVRVSEYESVETALSLTGLAHWAWIDTFTRLTLTGSDADRLRRAGYRLCLVSPELQGRRDPSAIREMRAQLASEGIAADAVCTKLPELWR